MGWLSEVITSRKRQQRSSLGARLRAMQEVRQRYERIFRGSHGYGFVDWDFKNRKMDWNGGFWAYLGYGETDMEHISSPGQFMEYVHTDDRAKVNNFVLGELKGVGSGELVFRIRKKKGGYIWAEVRVDNVRDSQGRVSFMSGVVFDVTKQKQTEQALLISEARHARIIQSSNDGIWEWSADHGGFQFSNRCWELLGYDQHDDELNQGVDKVQAWRDRMHPEDGELFDRTLEKHIKGEGPFDVEYRIKGKNGNWRWIRGRGQLAFDAAGQPLRMSGTNMDITQLKQAEEKVVKAKELAEKANKAKSEFLSSMSHELRTPLNAILGFAQLFELDKNLNPAQRENIGEIEKAGKHLLELIGDVLDLAKIEAGKMDFELEQLNPMRLVDECIPLMRPLAVKNRVEINVHNFELGNASVRADSVRLKQVFINLISNAIKYNRKDGRVDIVFSETEEGHLRVSVQDTGFGIPLKQQKYMFQPFNRLGAERGEIEGSGVGLVITRQLVEQMGGELGFSSDEGKGSKFWVQLPLYSESAIGEYLGEAADVATAVQAEQGELPTLRVAERKNILYIEDNPPNQRLMRQVLSRFPVLHLEVVEEALRGIFMARTQHPDLIILDINMPGINGYEALNVLRKDPATQKIPVIALSANAMSHDIEKGMASGFDVYLTKPLNLALLIDAINELIADEAF
ncbi:PAS domain-containing protein [Saccharophagus degradans]|uniref:histidine kinase n=1 Tax=Saccharophagus degradans (strain 2-40 / ATCC 43961 / DSM 17024) TaxID=203122 RepID=Q21KV8_SACD2|nr:PAS domain-containing protein [Saccharophagus degradans]ABD80671.1 ATP-binding region, ATPase-like protein [Saccharophagus degradans 2-40]